MNNLTLNRWIWGSLTIALSVVGWLASAWWLSRAPQKNSEFAQGSPVDLDQLSPD